MSLIARLKELLTPKPREDDRSSLRDEPNRRNPADMPSSGAVVRPPDAGLGGGPT